MRLRLALARGGAGLIGALLVLLIACPADSTDIASAGSRPSPPSPGAILTEFYGWYLGEIERDHAPVEDASRTMGDFVSQPLIEKLQNSISTNEYSDHDYFTHAQYYFPDWIAHITVSDLRIEGTKAAARVTLGADAQSRHRIAVWLSKEHGRWKIYKVAASSSASD